jgi:electron transfer flavoprotein beta subunit
LVRSGPGRLNPHDWGALELAARIKDATLAKADVFSMGPRAAGEIIASALDLAGGEGFLLTGRAFAGADSLATARALAAALELKGPYDLVICGPFTTDGGTAQVGPALSALTGRAYVGGAENLMKASENDLTLLRRESGERAVVKISFPAVCSVLKGALAPRIPSVKDKLRKKTVSLITLSELPDPDPGLYGESGSGTVILKTGKPPKPAKLALSPNPEEAAAIIFAEAAPLG